MLIDAHVHVDRYGAALPAALEEIRTNRIFTIATAMDVPSYLEARRIAARTDLLLPAFGVHPRRAPDYATRLASIAEHIDSSPLLGEIGLDFHWIEDRATDAAQRRVLAYFLAAAREQKKIVNLHTKGAEKEIVGLLERYDIGRAIIHWYSGPLDVLKALVEYGAYFTVGVEVLYSDAIRRIAESIPDHLLLTETDNPGGLKWLEGTIGMPGIIREVLACLARIRNMPEPTLEAVIQRNFLRLIANDPWLADTAAVLAAP